MSLWLQEVLDDIHSMEWTGVEESGRTENSDELLKGPVIASRYNTKGQRVKHLQGFNSPVDAHLELDQELFLMFKEMRMRSDVAVVTGWNKGFGYQVARALCKDFSGVVYLVGSSVKTGMATLAKLRKEGLSFYPKFYPVNPDSQESILSFREHLRSTHGGFNLLVNNPESGHVSQQTSFTRIVNICRGLFPLLRTNARVIHVSSAEARYSPLPEKEPELRALRHHFFDRNLTNSTFLDLVNAFVSLTSTSKRVIKKRLNHEFNVSRLGVSSLSRIHQRDLDEWRPYDNILVNSLHPVRLGKSRRVNKSIQLAVPYGNVTTLEWLGLQQSEEVLITVDEEEEDSSPPPAFMITEYDQPIDLSL